MLTENIYLTKTPDKPNRIRAMAKTVFQLNRIFRNGSRETPKTITRAEKKL